jgi:hypothetical protein
MLHVTKKNYTEVVVQSRKDVFESSKKDIESLQDYKSSTLDEQNESTNCGVDICNARHSHVHVKKSDIGGYGVFSRRGTKLGELIVDRCYGGPLIVTIDDEKGSVLPWQMAGSDYIFSFKVDDEGTECTAFIDALHPISSVLRFVNSSTSIDTANVYAYVERGRVYYKADRDIKPGEEYLIYYGDEYWKDRRDMLKSVRKTETFSVILTPPSIPTIMIPTVRRSLKRKTVD